MAGPGARRSTDMTDFRRFMRKLTALLLPVVLVVPAIGLASRLSGHQRDTHPSDSGAAIVNVHSASLGPSIPASFLGLSLEFSAITRYAGTDGEALDPVFLQLIRNLTPGQDPLLRVGGASTDSAWWPMPKQRRPSEARIVLTPRWIGVTASLARQLSAGLILGINLKTASRSEASAEASAFERGLGPHIEALELGYKPELYPRFGAHRDSDGRHVPGSHTRRDLSSFSRAYTSFAKVLPGALAGPVAAAPAWTRQLGGFLAAEPRVRVATLEASPQEGCSVAGLRTAVRAAHTHQVPLRIEELNPASCGNGHGVNNSFAAALSALAALFQMARIGVDGVDIQTSPGEPGELFRFRHAKHGWKGSVAPEYYGLMMFAQATPAGSRLVGVSTKNAAGIQAWATRGTDGQRQDRPR